MDFVSTNQTDEDYKREWKDECGVRYSKDKKKLLAISDYRLTDYTVREGTEIICDNAFAFASSLQSIVIPKSVTAIGYHAFARCKELKSITIPDSVISIGDGAFDNCSQLESIIIPDSVMELKGNPFAKCHATIINRSKYFTLFEGNLYTSDRKRLIAYLSNSDCFTVPDSVNCISERAFQNCATLRSVTIPNSVTSIGDFAFDNCSSLQSVNIPDSVNSIGEYNQEIKGETNVEIISVIA